MKKQNEKMIGAVVVAILTVGLSLTSCKKAQKGDVGPKGEIGPKGETGATGTAGTNGNANVIGTTYTVSTWAAAPGLGDWSADIPVAGITQNILDKGFVSVFMFSYNSWWSLPDITGVNSTQYGIGLGMVYLYNVNSDGTPPPNPGTKVFRVVVISPSNKAENPNLNWNNYNEVKKTLNLKD